MTDSQEGRAGAETVIEETETAGTEMTIEIAETVTAETVMTGGEIEGAETVTVEIAIAEIETVETMMLSEVFFQAEKEKWRFNALVRKYR